MYLHDRIVVLTFLGISMGIYVGKTYRYYSPIVLWVVIGIVAMLLIYTLLRKIYPGLYDIVSWKKVITVSISLVLGLSLFNITYITEKNIKLESIGVYKALGTVDSNYTFKENGMNVYLRDVMIVSQTESIELEYNVYVFINTQGAKEDAEIFNILPGDVMVFEGTIQPCSVVDQGYIYTNAYKNDYRYRSLTDYSSVGITKGTMGVMDSVRESIRQTLNNSMDKRYAGLAFSVILGDKSQLDNSIQKDLKTTGVAHIIAVSGLHVGFIVMLFLGLLKLCRSKRYINLIVITVVLILYCILCNMSPSVVRASLMAIFLLLGSALGKQNDRLTSVSTAGILILLFQPFYLFDISFLLSFSAVFAIFFLMPVFKNYMDRLKHPVITDTIAISLSAQIGTTPFIFSSFGTMSLISLIANVLIVPFFGIVFMLIFVLTFLTLILPFLSPILTLSQYGLWVIDKSCDLFASVPYASIPGFPLWDVTLILWVMSMFFFSYYCIKPKRVRLSLGIITSSLCAVSMLVKAVIT